MSGLLLPSGGKDAKIQEKTFREVKIELVWEMHCSVKCKKKKVEFQKISRCYLFNPDQLELAVLTHIIFLNVWEHKGILSFQA